MVEPLATRSAQDLMTDPLVEKPMLIEGLMGDGLGFLCASPKTGKSWLAMDISICVATGTPLWGHETQRGCVLHIPLEDTYERLRKRLWLITDEVEGNLFFATRAETLGKGLLDQLAMFYDEHPDLKLVVIDTLQMIRSSVRDYSYSSDYRELADLKRFADQRSITILLIHHTRKMGDSDVMNTVSGTNAITGAADFTWVLTKPSRDSQDGTLSITGRDMEQRKIHLEFRNHRWDLVKDVPAKKLAVASVPAWHLRGCGLHPLQRHMGGQDEGADGRSRNRRRFSRRLRQVPRSALHVPGEERRALFQAPYIVGFHGDA